METVTQEKEAMELSPKERQAWERLQRSLDVLAGLEAAALDSFKFKALEAYEQDGVVVGLSAAIRELTEAFHDVRPMTKNV